MSRGTLVPERLGDGSRHFEGWQATKRSAGAHGVRRGQVDAGQQEGQHTGRYLDLIRTAGVDDHALVCALRALEQVTPGD